MIYKTVTTVAIDRLRSMGIKVETPDAGWYLLLDFSELIGRHPLQKIHGSRALTEKLYQATGILLLPGEDFGLSPKAPLLRMAVVDFDHESAFRWAKKRRAACRLRGGDQANRFSPETSCSDRLEGLSWLKPIEDGLDRLSMWLSQPEKNGSRKVSQSQMKKPFLGRTAEPRGSNSL